MILGVVLALAWLSPVGASDAQDQMHRVGAWFKIYDDALVHWAVAVPPETDQRVIMTRKAPAAGPKKRVMVIYPRKSSAYDVAMTSMLAVFAGKALDVTFVAANYGNDPARGAALVAEAERERYDLVYAMGSESIAYIHAHHRGITVPVVSVCAKDPVQLGQMPDYDHGSGSNFAFTSLNLLVEVQMAYLRELRPSLKQIAILVDARNVSAIETQSRPLIAAAKAAGIDAFEVRVERPEEAAAELTTVMPEAVARLRTKDPDLAHSVFWITGSTSVFTEMATINAHADRVPVLSVVPEVVQEGEDSAVLSIGVSFESNAQLAAIYGAEVLTGKAKASELKVGIVSPPDIAINFRRAAAIALKIPFSFFEAASFVYDRTGRPVRLRGREVAAGES